KVEQIPHQPQPTVTAVETRQAVKTEPLAEDIVPIQERTEETPAPVVEQAAKVTVEQAPVNFFARIKSGLSRTRHQFTDGLSQLFSGGKQIDEELLEEIETQLLTADVGIAAT